MCFCPNRLKVPTENARGWAVELSFFCFIGGLKWYFASSAVERMVQPPSKTNLDPLLRAYAFFVGSTWFFLHSPIEWCVNFGIRPFLLMCFCPNRLKVPTENARGWAVEFSFFCFIGGLKWYFASSAVERMVQPPSKTNLDPLLWAYALFVSSTWFFLHILKWCPIEWCVNLEIRPFLLMCFCPNRLKVPTENARGWAVEFNFFCFIGGVKSYFASSAVERMAQPPSKTNLDPLLWAYALFVSSTWFFLHILKWCPIEWCVNLEIRPFLLMCFCPNRLNVPTENARGWAVEFNFFCFIGGLKWYFASSAVERMV